MKNILVGSLKAINTALNIIDEMAYLWSRDFLSVAIFPFLSTEYLDLNSFRMVNTDETDMIMNGIVIVSDIFIIINILKKAIVVTSHIK